MQALHPHDRMRTTLLRSGWRTENVRPILQSGLVLLAADPCCSVPQSNLDPGPKSHGIARVPGLPGPGQRHALRLH